MKELKLDLGKTDVTFKVANDRVPLVLDEILGVVQLDLSIKEVRKALRECNNPFVLDILFYYYKGKLDKKDKKYLGEKFKAFGPKIRARYGKEYLKKLLEECEV